MGIPRVFEASFDTVKFDVKSAGGSGDANPKPTFTSNG
jgi:hypothetical protein